MVVGLDTFKAHFAGFSDRYVLIGGTACDLVMDQVGMSFRATKDLDIVLCIEALDAEFAKAFWAFVRKGKYENRGKAEGKRQFYRFSRPKAEGYPFMLELFSRVPDVLDIAEGSHLTPIPIGDAVSSLSAILLDRSYYNWICSGREEIDGLLVVGAPHLIPLKAKAWMDLSDRKAAGEDIDSRDVKKHRSDVIRLLPLLSPDRIGDLPDRIRGMQAALRSAYPAHVKVLVHDDGETDPVVRRYVDGNEVIENVLIANAHTHASPDCIGVYGPDSYTSGRNPDPAGLCSSSTWSPPSP